MSELVELIWPQWLFSGLKFKKKDAFIYNSAQSYGRWVEGLPLQFPGGVKVVLWNLRFELGCLGLCDLHAVQRANKLDVALCRVWKDVRINHTGGEADWSLSGNLENEWK